MTETPHYFNRTEAIGRFTSETGSMVENALAYLPKVEMAHCQMCEEWIAHFHPVKRMITPEELSAAIGQYREDLFLQSINA